MESLTVNKKNPVAPLQIRILGAISEVPRARWDALLDAFASPFAEWAWLDALETSGCASKRSGWTPQHVTVWRGDELVAAAPAYLREDSDGDFSRDWDWASAASRGGLRYYPKLSITVPFTPATGRRVLVAPGEDRAACVGQVVGAATEVAKSLRCGSVQVLFTDAGETDELEAAGMIRRVSFQYHWRNYGYRDTADFLSRFTSKRRTMIKRERAAPAKQGIEIRTVRGDELAADPVRWADDVFALHASTVDKLMWGRRWLNREFYRRVFASMSNRIEVVEARRNGTLIAGAFNVASATRLYGRYWGCHEDHPFLHFNVCYYHSVDECIRRGIEVFEGGAGGEHKLPRGFEPAETYSTHSFFDARLDRALRNHLAVETQDRVKMLEEWRRSEPVLKPVQPSSQTT
jgi:predicted N-acyltransferase